MLTFTRIAFKALVWGLVGLGLALGIFLWRLSAGPVALDWLQPQIEQALAPGHADLAVTVGRTELRLNEDRRTIELIGADVRYGSKNGRSGESLPRLVFPEVTIALSVEAFLKHGLVAASRVVANAPSLVITRSRDGVIGLYSDTPDDEAMADIDFAAFLRHFLLAPASDQRIAYLEQLQIAGGRVAYYDRTRSKVLTAEAADLRLTRRDGGVDGWLRADLIQVTGGRASIQLSGRFEADKARLPFDIDVTNLMPADLPSLWPLDTPTPPAALNGARLPVHASIEGDIGLDGSLSPLTIDLDMSTGVIDLPDILSRPLKVTAAEFKGVVDADIGRIDIEKVRLESGEATLTGDGRINWRPGERAVGLDVAANGVHAEDLSTFWPPALGPDARQWVLSNITAGRVTRAEARLDLRPADFGPGLLRPEAVQGSFAFEGLTVRYVDTMPSLEGATGEATFDADRMDFTVGGGRNEGVLLDHGTVSITGMGKPGKLATKLKVIAEAHGPIDRALSLLAHPPLDVVKDLKIQPDQTSGEVRAKLDIRMPLHDDVTEDEVEVLADADLVDTVIGGLPRLGDEARLEGGAFKLVVDGEAVRLDGSARVNGLPLDIGIVEPLAEGAAKRRLRLRGKLTPDQLDASGMAIGGLEGAVPFDATVTETADYLWVDLDADLKELGIAIPGLIWQKSADDEGRLRASIAIPNDGPIDVKQFEIDTSGLRAVGSLELAVSTFAINALNVGELRIADTDAAIRVSASDRFGYEIVVDARRLDLDGLLVDSDESETDSTLERFHLVFRAKELRTRGLELVDVEADAFRRMEGWQSASFLGALADGGKIAFELVPDGEAQRLDLRSDDAGALIEALDLGQQVEGGTFHLSARLASQTPLVADGRLEIDRFTLRDAPLLARLLTVASLTGIGNLLGGEGIQFDQLLLPLGLRDQKLTITDGLLRGSQLGLTVKGDVALENEVIDLAGTVIPVYTLNRLIGKVPIIGRILTGTEGRGAFAATYQIEGPLSQPTVYVNPLSIVTPGLIRDFFSGLLNGTLEPPDIRETDD